MSITNEKLTVQIAEKRRFFKSLSDSAALDMPERNRTSPLSARFYWSQEGRAHPCAAQDALRSMLPRSRPRRGQRETPTRRSPPPHARDRRVKGRAGRGRDRAFVQTWALRRDGLDAEQHAPQRSARPESSPKRQACPNENRRPEQTGRR